MRKAGLKTKKEGKLGPVNIMLSISPSFSYFKLFQGFRKTQKESTASIFLFFFLDVFFATVMTIH